MTKLIDLVIHFADIRSHVDRDKTIGVTLVVVSLVNYWLPEEVRGVALAGGMIGGLGLWACATIGRRVLLKPLAQVLLTHPEWVAFLKERGL